MAYQDTIKTLQLQSIRVFYLKPYYSSHWLTGDFRSQELPAQEILRHDPLLLFNL
jgi:hypothetical protein